MSHAYRSVSVQALLNDKRLAPLALEVLAGERGLDRLVDNPRLQKPGLALAGFLAYVKPGRVQIIGGSEAEYLATLEEPLLQERVSRVVSLKPPLIVVTKGMRSTAHHFAPACQEHGVVLALSPHTTSTAIARLSSTLEFLLAPRTWLSGNLLDIFAIGVLLLGDSGMGKSECALELIHRGHRLVADDVVEVFRVRQDELFGQAPERSRGVLEVRGLGTISIEQLFGVVAVRDTKPIDLVVRLVPEVPGQADRLGLEERTMEILGILRPCIEVPVAAGRSLALLVECAARRQLLVQRGVTDLGKAFLLEHDGGLLR